MTISITQILIIIFIIVFFFSDFKQLKKKINVLFRNLDKIKNRDEKNNTRKKGS